MTEYSEIISCIITVFVCLFFSPEMPTDFLFDFPTTGILDYASLEGFSQTLDNVSCFLTHLETLHGFCPTSRKVVWVLIKSKLH